MPILQQFGSRTNPREIPMKSSPRHSRPSGLFVLLLLASPMGHLLRAQASAAPQVAVTAAAPAAPVTVGDLVAPIALYPDQLLGQVLTISATPQEVLDLGNWLIENDTLTGGKAQDAAKEAGFSTSAQYLALLPAGRGQHVPADRLDHAAG
jgi:hypothetical protein